jgi:hypothetical protein
MRPPAIVELPRTAAVPHQQHPQSEKPPIRK